MDHKLLDKLKRITPEEQEILDGKKDINRSIYMNSYSSNIIDCKKLLEQNKLIQVRPHTRFVHFPAHKHNYVEVIYMCKGHTIHIVNGEKVDLREGELLFLSQNATQEILPADFDDIAVNFIILPEFFDSTLKLIEKEENQLRDFVIGCLKNDNRISYLHFKVSDILPIQNLIENLIWTILNKQPNIRSINQMTMGLLFLQLMNHMDKVSVGKNQYEQELTIQVLSFIEENYKEGQLTDLADKLQCDLYWLSRIIKRLTGKTYTELVQNKRLNQAAYLLTTTKLTVADISYAVGYDNLSYFHRIFKKRFHASPKEYRSCK